MSSLTYGDRLKLDFSPEFFKFSIRPVVTAVIPAITNLEQNFIIQFAKLLLRLLSEREVWSLIPVALISKNH